MKKIKHIIGTRFYCYDMLSRDIIFNKDFLDKNLNILKNSFLMSLENQTCKNFELVLIIHNEIDMKLVHSLFDLTASFPIKVLRERDYRQYCNAFNDDYDFTITTRSDHDDLIYKDAVYDTQKIIKENQLDCAFCGFWDGCTVLDRNFSDARIFHEDYKKAGFHSCFQSLIIRNNLNKDRLTVYMFPHYNVKPKFEELPIENKEFIEIKEPMAFCYMGNTSMNVSSLHNKAPKNWHTSDIKVNKDLSYFKERFGVCE